MATTTPSVTSSLKAPPAPPAPGATDTFAAEAEAAADTVDLATRLEKAQSVVHRNVGWALGVGLVPIPIVDFIGVSGVQLKMLRELAALYGVKFSEQLAKKIVATLVAGLGSAGLGSVLAVSFLKFVPLVGTSLGALSMPALSGAFTLATGRIFVAHFESGGTILDFKPHAIREHFRAEFERAKKSVSYMKGEESAKPGAASMAPPKA
jgi:uncharacterized protein (DUF697 family)